MFPRPALIIALSDPLVATSLSRALAPAYGAVESVDSLAGLLNRLRAQRPSIVVVGTELGDDSMLLRLPQLVNAFTHCQFVACLQRPDSGLREFFQFHGVRAVIDYGEPLERMLEGIEAIMTGAPWPSSSGGTGHAPEDCMRRPMEPLSVREHQLLLLLRSGQSHRAAAESLGLSGKTEEYYSRSLRRKFGFPARVRIDWKKCEPE